MARAARRRRAARRLAAARLHAPAARPAGLPRPPPAGLLLDAASAIASAFASSRSQVDELPLGAGALAGVNFDTDRAMVADELGFVGRRAELDRRRVQPRLHPRLPRRRARPARRTSRASAPSSSCGRARSSASSSCPTPGRAAARSCRRRRTPTPPSCCAPRRRASSAHLAALHGVLHALPLTYNKDLQEDKEHLFDAVDTLRLCLAAAARDVRGASFNRERMAAAASDELIAATDLADLLVRRGVPFRESHGIVAGLVRESVTSGRKLGELTPRGVAAHSEHLDARPTRCSPVAHGSSRRSAKAGRRSRACASSSSGAGATDWRWPAALDAALPASFYARPVRRGRAAT